MSAAALRHGLLLALALGLPHAAADGASVPKRASASARDVAAARELFQANLDAIRRRDREAYLGCYLESEALARTGPDGLRLGFEDHAAAAGEAWPDVFEGLDLQLVPVSPGVVYGTYRYRVSYAGDEHSGISERLFVRTDRGFKIAVTSAIDAPPGTPPAPRALVGATLIDGTGAAPVARAVLLMRGGRIDCAGSAADCPVPSGVDVVDLHGKWITPGLIDAHVHFSQTGWADGRPDSLDLRERYPYDEVEARLREHPQRFLRAYLCSGVTAVFDVGGYPWTWELRRRFDADTLAPHLVVAGPLLSTLDFWLNLPAERQFLYLADEPSAREGVRYLAAHGADAVKVWFIPVEDRDFDRMAAAVAAAGDEARSRGLPLIVHATGLREAKAALSAGARMLVHSVWDRPVDDEFLDLAREKGAIYCPTITVLDGYRRMLQSVLDGAPPQVDDPNGCVDPLTLEHVAETQHLGAERVEREQVARRAAAVLERTRTMQQNLLRVHRSGIPVAMGTDAGNPLTLHGPAVYAELEAMQAAGLSPHEVLVASTRGGALALGREDEIGTLEPGKVADLLVLDADPLADVANLRRVALVVRGGVVRAVAELRPLAE